MTKYKSTSQEIVSKNILTDKNESAKNEMIGEDSPNNGNAYKNENKNIEFDFKNAKNIELKRCHIKY